MIPGKKIVLRPATMADRQMAYEWACRSDIAHFLNPADEPLPDFDTWCRDYHRHYFSDEKPHAGRLFIICLADTPVGIIAYNQVDSKNRVELDIWMDSEANCGKGFGPDAVETHCAYLANTFGVHTFMMGSKLRKWLANPTKTLRGAHIQAGQSILEVGCGTGFFTIPAAGMLGAGGSLIAMDVSAGFIEVLSKKVKQAGLNNVRIIQRDAINTGLESASVDMVLLFGVIPFPLLPLNQLLPEMHRVIKPDGALAVWLFPPLVHGWVPGRITQ